VEVREGPRGGFASREASLEFFRGADAIVSWVTDRVDGGFLDAVGPRLRVVANFAVGYDNIDVAACAERGVVVTNTPDAVTDGTADVAVTLMLSAARRFPEADRYVRSGEFARNGVLNPDEFIGLPVHGQTLLIVGAGRIGYATARRMIGWEMDVLYHARTRKPDFEAPPVSGAFVEDLDEGLRRADFVSVHTPLAPETRHQIDARRIGLMKPTAVLVNTARGPVVDEDAVVAALREGRLAAAGFDVYEREPDQAAGLRELENVAFTPHFGSANTRSREEMVDLCARNIAGVLGGTGAVTEVRPAGG
jgi:glyoxylate reductase